ncbi:unnamed protein product [Gordionus sp. m RMFG-2023]
MIPVPGTSKRYENKIRPGSTIRSPRVSDTTEILDFIECHKTKDWTRHIGSDIIEKDVKGGGDYNVSTRPPLNANPPCLSYRETEVTSSKTPNLPLLKTNFHDFFSGGEDPACLISGDKTKVTTRFVAEEKNIMFAPEATNYYSMVTPRKRLSDIRDENKSNLN